MSRTVKTNILLIIFAGLLTVGIFNCGEDSTTNTQTTTKPAISGTVTFFDTNRVSDNGYYNVSVYTNWPPTSQPAGGDTLHISKINDTTYIGTYTIKDLTKGANYVTVAAWIKEPYAQGSVYVLGVRGCDTSVSCAFIPPTGVTWDTIKTDAGLTGIDFKATIDTTKKMYNF